MELSQALIQVESADLSNRLNLASSFRSLIDALRVEPSALVVADHLRSLDDGNRTAETVALRVVRQAERATDVRFEHPGDAAMAAYLWLLSLYFPPVSKVAAESVIKLPNVWWSRKVADFILFQRDVQSSADTGVRDIVVDRSALVLNTSDLDTSDEWLLARQSNPDRWKISSGPARLSRPAVHTDAT